MTMRLDSMILKADEERQMVLIAPVEPDAIDTQGDFFRPPTVEKMAHDFMEAGRTKSITIAHNGKAIDATVVESFIDRAGGPDVKPGTWKVWLKIGDPTVWNMIKAKMLNGVSIEAIARRVDSALNGIPAKEIVDATVGVLSLVDRPANRKPILMTKSEQTDAMAAVTAALSTIAKGLEQLLKQQDETAKLIGDELAKATNTDAEYEAELMRWRTDITGTVPPPGRQHISKAAAEAAVRDGAEIARHRSRIDALNREFERLGEGEISFERRDVRERHILREIEKSETELAALGYDNAARLTDPERSSFFQRGGSSNFLVSNMSTAEAELGLRTRRSAAVQKAEDAVDLDWGGLGISRRVR